MLTTIWPLFALICLGFALARSGFPGEGFWPAAERINYVMLFPALLVKSLADAPLNDPAILQLGAAAVVTILVAALALAAFRQLRPIPAARFGAILQGAVRFNTYLGLAILATMGGSQGIERAAVYLAIVIPLVNVLSILALRQPEQGKGLVTLLRSILGNPLILACLAGFALAYSHVGLPFGTERFLDLLAQSSLPLGLLCVGAAMRPDAIRDNGAVLAANSVLRLLIMPLLALVAARTFGLQHIETLVLVVFSAIPTAPTSYILTRSLGGDADLMAGIVTSQTLIAAATIPLVLSFL